MSDVEAVSLPAALDVGQNIAPVKPGPVAPSPGNGDSHRVDEDKDNLNAPEGPPSPRADSEAETIIQSGRESLSPEKKRKPIKHDLSRREPNGIDGHRKKPRVLTERDSSRSPHRELSPSMVKIEKVDDALPETEGVPNGIDRARPRAFRKRSFSDSAEEQREHRRAHSHASHPARELKHNNHTRLSRPPSNPRSLSPNRRSHQRSASSSQFPVKKQAPTPLLTGFGRHSSEDRQSTDSSASGSPLPGAPQLRKLGSGTGASASPAKQMGPKKLRDKSGRTPLARACADRKHDQVMMRHAERPGDINVPDNAGNTPLQIASLAGEADIVKFLLEAGCEINTKNIDKDTPLIDAVENGNVEVVKLLLDAGANPRTVNAEGDEPYELVPSFVDDDEYEEMRKALADAKANLRPGRRSEEHTRADSKEPSSRRTSAARGSATSPRESPPMRSPPPAGSAASRRKGGRSEATRNDLLWTKPTFENLREFAAKGDEAGVVSILNILQKADNASLIAAAKGGHHDVLSLLYAMGNADADPNPLRGQKAGYNTPMLAAIGRGNSAVIQLILSQPGFDPTRRLYEDRTYFDLSRGRMGENWEDEYRLLKDAYEKFPGEKNRKDDSPRRARKEKEDKRVARKTSPSPVRMKKNPASPILNSSRDSFKDIHLNKEKRQKDVSSRSRDHKPKPGLLTRRDSESSGMARSDEVKKRRLIAGRRPQERRPSLFSSDSLSGRDEAPRSREGESHHSLKRIRTDRTPERSRSRGTESGRLSPEMRGKKRRVASEDQELNGISRLDEQKPRRNEDGVPPDAKPETKKPRSRFSSPTLDLKKNEDMKEPSDMTMEDVDTKRAEIEADERARAQARKSQDENAAVDQRATDEKRAIDEKHATEQRRVEGEKRAADERRAADEIRLADEKRATEERRAADEKRAADDQRIAEETRKAAQAAREKADEEGRKRKEADQRRARQAEDDRQKRLEQERARLAKVRRDREALEQQRRDALPSRLRVAANLVGSHDPRAKSHDWLNSFMPLVTALTRQIDPSCAIDMAEEKWIPNYLVAPLLATNDLQLSQYASWEKRQATPTQRANLWRVTRRMLNYMENFAQSTVGEIMQQDCDNRPKYFEMEHVFWIRLSDFTDLVPHIPHLHGLELQFLSMHVDPEPPAAGTSSESHINGHGPKSTELNGIGSINGYGQYRSY